MSDPRGMKGEDIVGQLVHGPPGQEPAFRFSGPAEINRRLTDAVEGLRAETKTTAARMLWLTVALVVLTVALLGATLALVLH